MENSFHVQDSVIVHRFSGEVRLADMIESWNELLANSFNLKDYKGIVSIFLDAEVIHEDDNLNILVEYLKGYLDHLRDLKIAIVMDTPMVTSTIIIGQRFKHLQIKPFTTEKAAMEWVRI